MLCFTGPQSRRAPKQTRDGSLDGQSTVESALLESLKRPGPSATELFLLSLVPAVESVPPQTREFVKFQFQKIVFENTTAVLHLEPLDPSNQYFSENMWQQTLYSTNNAQLTTDYLLILLHSVMELLSLFWLSWMVDLMMQIRGTIDWWQERGRLTL